jgi:molybdopterin-guanine dinucleotide biosynthesis protein A
MVRLMPPARPLGAVLAGGAARRMGGAKATAPLAGRPLADWAIAALRAAGLDDVVVVAKRATALGGVEAPVWLEPDEPRHPLAGVRHALAQANGRPVVTLPVDLPLVPADVLLRLVEHAPGPTAVVIRAGGRLHPLVARFAPAAHDRLAPHGRATDAVLALGPAILDVPADGFENVNTPADLAAAEAALSRRAG